MPLSLKQVVWRCIKAPERYAMKIDYAGEKSTTRRFISPTKFGPGKKTIFALCLARQENRQFRVDRILKFEIVNANELLMPIAAEVVCPETGDGTPE